MKDGLRDGTIDAIATDHAPHHRDEKEVEFDQAAHGVTGLETALSLTLHLVQDGVLSLSEAVQKLSANPARILGLPSGTLAVGKPADLTIFDAQASWRLEPLAARSRSQNTPFAGWELTGKVQLTMVDGRIVYDDREQEGQPA